MRIVSTIVCAGLLLLASGLAAPAAADQNDPRLDPLFRRLSEADGPREARAIAAAIWSIWYQHPDDSVEALMRAGRAALDDGDHQGALFAFDDAVRKAPNYAEAWNARATTHYMMGNYQRSLADIRRTLTLEPRHFGALSGRGLCHMKLGHPEKAIRAFERSLEINPFQPGVKAHLQRLRRELQGRSL